MITKNINSPSGKKYDQISVPGIVLDDEPVEGSFNGITSDAAAKIAGGVADLDAIVPDDASEENKLATASDVAGVQEDVDGIEGKIPSDTSTANKLVNESGLQDAIDNASESWSTGFTPKGEASVSAINALSGQSNGDSYILSDSGTLTEGSLAVQAGDQVAWDSTGEKWYIVGSNAVGRFKIESNEEFSYLVKDIDGRVVFGFDKNGAMIVGDKTLFYTVIREFLANYVLSHMAFGVYGSESYTVLGIDSDGAKHNYCTSFGWSNQKNNTGVKNTTFGAELLQWCTGHDVTANGYHSQYRTTSGSYGTSIGSESMDDNTTGNHNTATGYCALQRNNTGGENTANGAFALQGGYVAYDGNNPKSFAKNVANGYAALGSCLTGTEKSVGVGNRALPSARVYKNCIGIGYNVDCNEDDMTVIGNADTKKTVVRGDFFVKATDGTTRQIVFNLDGTCSWVSV